MKIPRSTFLVSLGSAAFGALVTPSPLVAGFSLGRRRYVMVKDLDLSTFSPHVNTRFRVRRDASAAVDVELIEATDRSDRGSANSGGVQRECFSLVFRGPHGALLEQNTYEIQHDRIGTFHLFVVPVGQDDKGIQYEAIFNRIRPKTV